MLKKTNLPLGAKKKEKCNTKQYDTAMRVMRDIIVVVINLLNNLFRTADRFKTQNFSRTGFQ